MGYGEFPTICVVNLCFLVIPANTQPAVLLFVNLLPEHPRSALLRTAHQYRTPQPVLFSVKFDERFGLVDIVSVYIHSLKELSIVRLIIR